MKKRIAPAHSWLHWTGKLVTVLTIISVIPLAVYAQRPQDAFTAAVANHGGVTAINAVQTLRIVGESTSRNGKTPVTMSVDLNGRMRIDYGQPVTRSLVHTPQGETEIVDGKTLHKQAFVGLFGGLDLFSIVGLKRLQLGGTVWTDAGSAIEAGRAVAQRKVDTGVRERHYGRTVKDEFDIKFDVESGLVSSITRQQFAENSMDLVFPVRYAFSDYRSIGGVLFPYRIDKYVFGRLAETILATTVETNPVLPTTLFVR
jgi:hypothetical protein